MTDKELLELAAKVMQTTEEPSFANYEVMGSVVCLHVGASRGDITRYWNPLTDDGDALRLAVNLKLTVLPWGAGAAVVVITPDDVSVHEPHYGDDPARATRRAIVRAAAEIGKAMP